MMSQQASADQQEDLSVAPATVPEAESEKEGESEAAETPFVPPSIDHDALASGDSYTYFSPLPAHHVANDSERYVLGVDEAGRGPVLGPMVYGAFYAPRSLADTLLTTPPHKFDDSKVLTPACRTSLMRRVCDHRANSAIASRCGWAVDALSARDIASGMLRPARTLGPYNLNAQALDATARLVSGVLARGVQVVGLYVDTVGGPEAHARELRRLFPGVAEITVQPKADSLFSVVSAASVVAKVTRDAALDALHGHWQRRTKLLSGVGVEGVGMSWGSGYPSDRVCQAWLKANMHPLFGWGSPECRFSWATASELLESKDGVRVEWSDEDGATKARLADFLVGKGEAGGGGEELGTWFGTPAGLDTF